MGVPNTFLDNEFTEWDDNMPIESATTDFDQRTERMLLDKYFNQTRSAKSLSKSEVFEISMNAYATKQEINSILSRSSVCQNHFYRIANKIISNNQVPTSYFISFGDHSYAEAERISNLNFELSAQNNDSRHDLGTEDVDVLNENLRIVVKNQNQPDMLTTLFTQFRPNPALWQRYLSRFNEWAEEAYGFKTRFFSLISDLNIKLDSKILFALSNSKSVIPLLEKNITLTSAQSLQISDLCDEISGWQEKYRISLQDALQLRSQYNLYASKYRELITTIVRSNLLLVSDVIVKNSIRSDDLFEAIQDGNEELISSAERFSPWLHYCFSTFASCRIKHIVSRKHVAFGSSFSIPASFVVKGAKIRAAKRKLIAERNVDNITSKDIEIETGIPSVEVSRILSAWNHPCRNQHANSDSIDEELINLIPDENLHDFGDDADKGKLKQVVDKILDELPPLHRDVATKRFGLNNSSGMTIEEIAKSLDVSSATARKYINELLGMIRTSIYAKDIEQMHCELNL